MRLGLLALLATIAVLALEVLLATVLHHSLTLWETVAPPLGAGAVAFAAAGRRRAIVRQRARQRRRAIPVSNGVAKTG